MSNLRAPLLVGLVGVAAVVTLFLLFGTVRKDVVSEGKGYRVYADFEDVAGLAKSSRVTISGVPVGTMDNIELITLPDGSSKARVWLRMKDDVKLSAGTLGPDENLVNAATITRRSATMLGDYYLEISPGVGEVHLKDGDAIPNVVGESGLMAIAKKLEGATDIFPKIQQIADEVQIITSSLSNVLGGVEGEQRIRDVVDDVVRSADDISKATADIRAFVGHELGTEGKPGRFGNIVANLESFSADASRFSNRSVDDLSQTIANIEAITADLRDILAQPSQQDGDTKRIELAMERVEATISNLERASKAVAEITETVNKGEGTVGKLLKDDQIAKDTQHIVQDIGDLVGSFSRLKTEIGFRSEFNILQRNIKNYLTLRFVPDRTKYYLIELVWDPRGRTSTFERVTYTNDPRLPSVLTERVVETKEGIKFTLQLARALWLANDKVTLTGRFGLIESTGAIGGDLGFFNNSFKISADLFDFAADYYPRLKLLASNNFLNYLYITAGVDDVINSRGRDYFVGAGFRFLDADLKALLITAPTPSL
ncbi:MAG TPA: MlaD family protein [Myxococcota bacterium]|nr:MlaD family protein [Myxococcota bacterium]